MGGDIVRGNYALNTSNIVKTDSVDYSVTVLL